MISLYTLLPTLTFFHASQLFNFTMKLPNIPAHSTHILSVMTAVLGIFWKRLGNTSARPRKIDRNNATLSGIGEN